MENKEYLCKGKVLSDKDKITKKKEGDSPFSRPRVMQNAHYGKK